MPNRDTIDARDLATTWRTLRAVARNHELGSPAESYLAAARKLIAAEVRTQHGVDAWTDMVEGNTTQP